MELKVSAVFNIRVKLPKEKKLIIRPRNSDVKIAEIMGIIEDLEGLESDMYVLIFRRIKLLSTYSLAHYNIRRGYTIKLLPKNKAKFEILIKIEGTFRYVPKNPWILSEPMRFVVDEWDFVETMKDTIRAEIGGPLLLNYQEKLLNDSRFLVCYRIPSGHSFVVPPVDSLLIWIP